MPVTVQRLGTASRLVLYPETTWNTDPGSPAGFVLPLYAQAGFGSQDSLIDAPIFTGDMLPFSVINGMITATGQVPLGLEYNTSGYLWKAFVGANGYLRPGGGATTQHQFFIPIVAGSTPGSVQMQSEFLDGTPIYLRQKGVRVNGFNYQTNLQGVAQYTADLIGSGTEVQTDLAGAKTNNAYSASNYFNGQVSYTSAGVTTVLASMTALTFSTTANMQRQDVAFNLGIAGSLNSGNINAKAKMDLMFGNGGAGPSADLAYYNDAVNQVEVQLDFVWANGPLATCTAFKRVQLMAVRMPRVAPRPGGAAGIVYGQEGKLVRSTAAKTAGEYFLPNLGPYAIVAATSDKLGVKVDGGATLAVPLTAGAARTQAQILTDLQAFGALTAVANVTSFCGRPMITSKTVGSTSSVQIDAVQATNANTVLGVDTVVRTGKDTCPLLVTLFGGLGSSY